MEHQRPTRTIDPLLDRAREAVQFGRPVADDGDEDGIVDVVWGANMDALEVAGMTVDEIRGQLGAAYHIAPDAPVNVNGVSATGDTRVRAGDTVEFVHAAGEKGGS